MEEFESGNRDIDNTYKTYHRSVWETLPICTIFLIVINVIVFVACVTKNNVSRTGGANYEYVVEMGEYGRLLSSMFLHLNFEHLLMNMISLWLFGHDVEKYIGSLKMIIIYFLSGIGSGALSVFGFHLIDPDRLHFSIGASGAIFGIIAAYLYISNFYLARSSITRSNAAVITVASVIIYVVIDAVMARNMHVDNFGHFGGGITGFIAVVIMAKFFHADKMEGQMEKWIAVAVTILISVIAINFANLGGEAAILPETKINYVKGCSLTFAPDVELGEVLEEYCVNEKWTLIPTDEEGKDYVDFSGTCISGGNTVELRFRFVVDTKNSTIVILNIYRDNVLTNDREKSDTIIEVYTAYGEKHGMKFNFYGN
ncbi:MAG: rhomboid family intramembrane serine protease [Clostridium sp.]|nr:rhomboid family intramembrane serine protease [Clostridium sp.]